jgi:hypothetical protein
LISLAISSGYLLQGEGQAALLLLGLAAARCAGAEASRRRSFAGWGSEEDAGVQLGEVHITLGRGPGDAGAGGAVGRSIGEARCWARADQVRRQREEGRKEEGRNPNVCQIPI